MTMPKRIWTEGFGVDQDWGDWDAVQSDEYQHPYVRADLADGLAEALRNARRDLGDMAALSFGVSGKSREVVNAEFNGMARAAQERLHAALAAYEERCFACGDQGELEQLADDSFICARCAREREAT